MSRPWLIRAIFGFAVFVGVFAVLAVWIHRQVLNTESWTNTSSQLLANPQIQGLVGGVLVNELFSTVDVAAEIKTVLPSNLGGIAAPAAAGLRTLADEIAPKVLSTGPVQNGWRLANQTAQRELVRILKGGSRTISTSNGVVTLQLHPLLAQLASQLGLASQLESVQSGLSGAAGTSAKSTVQKKLGVKLPESSGNIVILRSSELNTAQNIVKAIEGLAIVLPSIAVLLFLLAVWLAEGRRRVAVRTTGWCLIAIGVIVLIARRIIESYLLNSLVKVDSDKPAFHQVFVIGTSLLADAAIAIVTYGAVLVAAAWLSGHTRPAVAVRRLLAPTLREHPLYVYGAAGLVLLLVILWGPFASTRQPIPLVGIAVVIALGIHALRRLTASEFPDVPSGEAAREIRAWYAARKSSFFSAIAAARGGATEGGEAVGHIAALERLASLHDRGALTDDEFRSEKALLMGGGT